MFNWGSVELGESNSEDNLKSVKLNPFTLAFPKLLETQFLTHYYFDSLGKINVAMFFGAIFYTSFFFLDYILVPEHIFHFLAVRFGITWLIVVITLNVINKAKNENLSQPMIALTSTTVALTIIYYIIIAYPKLNNSYYVGIIIVYFWSYSFLKLRFIWASISGILTFLFYELTIFAIIDVNYETVIISNAFLVATNFVGMIISYTLEYYARKDFYQNLLLKKSLEANINLNIKISEGDQAIGLAEEKLSLQSKALESAANSIMILNKEGNILWCNAAFTNLTGYKYEEVRGKNPRFLKSGKHDKIFYKNIWSTILKGNVWSGEIINKKKNGEIYYEEMVVTPVMNNESNTITHFIAIKQDISLRKEMEDELFESEKRLRSLFENATLGIYRSTLSGKILMANNALIKMLGFDSFEDLQQRDLTKAGYVKDDQRNLFLKKLNESQNLIGFESEWNKKDGTTIFIRESARLDIDEKGETIFEGTVEDITLSKIAQAELHESREKLQIVFDNLYDAIVIHDLEGKIININSKVLDLYNISMDEALKMTFRDISSDNNPMDIITDDWKQVVKEDKTYKFEWKAMRPMDKYVFDVEVFLSKITLGNNNYVLANIRDITEQKEANRKLLLSQKAVDLNATPIFWISKESKFLYVNNAAANQLGYTSDELLKMKLSDIDPHWSDEYFKEVGYPRLKEKGVDRFESVHRKKNGQEFPIEISSALIYYENEEVIISNIVDITERKNVAESILRAKEKAEQSDKLKSEFLAGMSHEIRTPINTILNFVSLIKTDLGENISSDIKSSFEMIDNGSRRLIRTIDSIINMSQLQAGAYDLKIELISLVDDILDRLFNEFKQIATQKKLEFSMINKTSDSRVLADQYTITQLFINLIDNALKYTNSGSIKIVIESDEKFLIAKIIDTGIGISEEFIPTLFDPFLQEEMGYTRSYEGNGLGLALVKKYLELNNGIIEVESKKGFGSTFTVKLLIPSQREVELNNIFKVLD